MGNSSSSSSSCDYQELCEEEKDSSGCMDSLINWYRRRKMISQHNSIDLELSFSFVKHLIYSSYKA